MKKIARELGRERGFARGLSLYEVSNRSSYLPFIVHSYSVNLGNISSIYKSLEQIHGDTTPFLFCLLQGKPNAYSKLCTEFTKTSKIRKAEFKDPE